MTLATVVFNYPDIHFPYQELHDVFRQSFIEHNPDIPFHTIRIDVPIDRSHADAGCWSNTAKLRAWVEFVEHADDDVILADCDMFCLGSAAHAFDEDFDVAYTALTVPQRGRPLNGGIVMIRNSIMGRSWLYALRSINEMMYANPSFHKQWVGKYAGMNQTAMGYMLEKYSDVFTVHAYRTREWNAVDCDWREDLSKTVFVHIKSLLRSGVTTPNGYIRGCNWLLKKWREMRERVEVMHA